MTYTRKGAPTGFAVLLIIAGLLQPLAAQASGSEVVKSLMAGNERFVKNKRQFPNMSPVTRQELDKNGQHPLVTILTCSDSRVPPEHIFDAGLGELFIVRVAGNVADTDEVGSVEYGTEHLKTPVLMVLGHSKCGAVTAVYKGDHVEGSIPSLVDNVIPAVQKAQAQFGKEFSSEGLERAINENVRQSVRDLITRSAMIRNLIDEGKLTVLGAVYHLDTGMVEQIPVDASTSGIQAAAETPVLAEEPAKAKTEETAEASTPASTPEAASASAGGPLTWLMGPAAILLALICHILLFAESTKIKRVKFKARLIFGGTIYLILALIPLISELSASAGRSWVSTALCMGSTAMVLVFMVVSFNVLSDHLGKIYHELQSRAESSQDAHLG